MIKKYFHFTLMFLLVNGNDFNVKDQYSSTVNAANSAAAAFGVARRVR